MVKDLKLGYGEITLKISLRASHGTTWSLHLQFTSYAYVAKLIPRLLNVATLCMR